MLLGKTCWSFMFRQYSAYPNAANGEGMVTRHHLVHPQKN
jgi:hypothetical protein